MAVKPPLKVKNNVVTFGANNDTTSTITVPLEIIDNAVGGQEPRRIILSLEYAGPPELEKFVSLGGGNSESTITVVIEDDDRKFCS